MIIIITIWCDPKVHCVIPTRQAGTRFTYPGGMEG